MEETNKVNNVHRITVRNKVPGTVQSGASTELLMDGQKMKAVKSFNVKIEANDIVVVTIEMYADVELDADVGIGQIEYVERL